MKIDRIEVKVIGPQVQRFTWSHDLPEQYTTNTIVRIFTDEGIEGFAGVSNYTSYSYDKYTAETLKHMIPALIGKNPLQRETLWKSLFSRVFPLSPGALAVVDTALWDLLGKVSNLPIYQLLGGARDYIPSYASTPLFKDVPAYLDFVDEIGRYALNVNDSFSFTLDDFLKQSIGGKKISEYFTNIIAKIGENIVLRRLSFVSKDSNSEFYSYTHNAYKPNIGKICVLLKAGVENNNEHTQQFGKNLCMHIAASKPLALDVDKLDLSLIEKEREVQLPTIKSSGKPENIIEKILECKMKKYFSEITLLNQPYIFDTDKDVRKAVLDFSSNHTFNIMNYEIFVLGS